MATPLTDPNWTLDNDVLTWHENPMADKYGDCDLLDFKIARWYSRTWSSQEICDGLAWDAIGEEDDDGAYWYVCRNKVYRGDTPVCLLIQTTGTWTLEGDGPEATPKYIATRRMLRRGCDHHKKYSVLPGLQPPALPRSE